MTKVRAVISILTTTMMIGGLVAPSGATHAVFEPSISGTWSPPFSEGGLFDERAPQTKEEGKKLPAAVSIAVLPNGTILYWNGIEGFEDPPIHNGIGAPTQKSRTRLLDLRAYLRGQASHPTWTTPLQERGIGSDLFCSDLRNLADGRVIVVGGTHYTSEDGGLGLPENLGFTEYNGTKETRFYDPDTGTWTAGADMNHARWYPSLLTLPGNKMLVAGGVEKVIVNEKLHYVRESETFDPYEPERGWVDNGLRGATELPFYARLHLLPSGKVFYDASGQMWGPGPYLIPGLPASSSPDQVEWNMQKLYDPASKTWTDAGIAPLGARSSTFSVMLPLSPPYDEARILVAGGTFSPVVPSSYVGTDITELVTVRGDTVQRTLGPRMNNGRWHSSGVVLPSGEVIAVNGGDREDNQAMGLTKAVRQAEMFDGRTWIPLADSGRDRVYHHTAVLLGDGSVLVGGHAPLGFSPLILSPDNYTHGVFASTLRDPSFEILKPPYLFRGARPRLVHVQAGVERGRSFRIATPDASKITSVVLSRLPSVTHLADVDQRTINLEFTRTAAGALEAIVPENPAIALDGHYYMFLIGDNGAGPTPSRAAIVQVGRTDVGAARLPFGI